MKLMAVKLTLLEECLGTASNDPNLHATYIASKAPDAMSREEEIAALGVEEVAEKQMTIFSRTKDGAPMLYDYQIKGFFKDTCKSMKKRSWTRSAAMKAYKQDIDGQIYTYPREIAWTLTGEVSVCERPLRASTPQGERVALASSEAIPAGSSIAFVILCYRDADVKTVEEWLDEGIVRGLGQWRNSGKGRFEWELLEEKDLGDTTTPKAVKAAQAMAAKL